MQEVNKDINHKLILDMYLFIFLKQHYFVDILRKLGENYAVAFARK